MILTKKNYLFFFFAVSNLFILIVGITGYLYINTVDFSQSLNRKFYSEILFFITLTTFLLSISVFCLMYVRSLKVYRELDKMIDITRYGNYDLSKGLKKLDRLGQKISVLFSHLVNFNELKTIKISSLSSIVNVMVSITDKVFLIIDVEGVISHCSKSFYKKYNMEPDQVLYSKIYFAKNIIFSNMLNEFYQFHEEISKDNVEVEIHKKLLKSNLLLVPVFNIKNELSNVIIIFENKGWL